MRCPSKKRLVETFKITVLDAVLFRQIAHTVDDKQESFEAVIDSDERFKDIAKQHEQDFDTVAGRVRIAMECFDKLLSTYGVVTVFGKSNVYSVGSYCNTGDSYGATICHHKLTNNFYISCWASAFPS